MPPRNVRFTLHLPDMSRKMQGEHVASYPKKGMTDCYFSSTNLPSFTS